MSFLTLQKLFIDKKLDLIINKRSISSRPITNINDKVSESVNPPILISTNPYEFLKELLRIMDRSTGNIQNSFQFDSFNKT